MSWLWRRLGPNARTRFARTRALAWAVAGVVSWPLGWANSVALVWLASVYANVESGIAAGEAADNRAVLVELAKLREETVNLRTEVKAMRQTVTRLDAHIARLTAEKEGDL